MRIPVGIEDRCPAPGEGTAAAISAAHDSQILPQIVVVHDHLQHTERPGCLICRETSALGHVLNFPGCPEAFVLLHCLKSCQIAERPVLIIRLSGGFLILELPGQFPQSRQNLTCIGAASGIARQQPVILQDAPQQPLKCPAKLLIALVKVLFQVTDNMVEADPAYPVVENTCR